MSLINLLMCPVTNSVFFQVSRVAIGWNLPEHVLVKMYILNSQCLTLRVRSLFVSYGFVKMWNYVIRVLKIYLILNKI